MRTDRSARLRVWAGGLESGSVISVTARVRLDNGQLVLLRDTLTGIGSPWYSTKDLALPPGELESAAAQLTTATIALVGWGWARLALAFPETPATEFDCLLAEGFLGGLRQLTWTPYGVLAAQSSEAQAVTFAVNSPLAGAEWNSGVLLMGCAQLLCVNYTLTTSAVVASRFSRLRVQFDSGPVAEVVCASVQVANQSVVYSAALGVVSQTILTAVKPLALCMLHADRQFRLLSGTVNMDVGDQYDAISYVGRFFVPSV